MTVNSIAQQNCETKGPNWFNWAKKNPGKAALAIFLASPTPTTTAAAVGLQIGDAWVKHSAKMEADNTKKTEKEIDSATKDHTEYPERTKLDLTNPPWKLIVPKKTEKEIDSATKE